jgi:hypothetical protein
VLASRWSAPHHQVTPAHTRAASRPRRRGRSTWAACAPRWSRGCSRGHSRHGFWCASRISIRNGPDRSTSVVSSTISVRSAFTGTRRRSGSPSAWRSTRTRSRGWMRRADCIPASARGRRSARQPPRRECADRVRGPDPRTVRRGRRRLRRAPRRRCARLPARGRRRRRSSGSGRGRARSRPSPSQRRARSCSRDCSNCPCPATRTFRSCSAEPDARAASAHR